MYCAILSDIHGNLFALEKVMEDMRAFDVKNAILLGDLIDYGMQSDEVVQYVAQQFPYEIICNLWGNHERAIMLHDFTRFSSQRGVACAQYTASRLSDGTKQYLNDSMTHEGCSAFTVCGKRCLAVHGSMEDHFWKAIAPDTVRGEYDEYDLVFSGHSHLPHLFSKFYRTDAPDRRNQHAVTFLNPGSVGQPRNHNCNAQYVLLDLETMNVLFRCVPYPISAAMALYDGSVDTFYQARLEKGI